MAKIDERKRIMASQRTPEQLKTIILKATQHLVAVGGMQNFSYPKLAAETGINAPTVYEHYKNKEDLLTSCFLTIDDEIARGHCEMWLNKSLNHELDIRGVEKHSDFQIFHNFINITQPFGYCLTCLGFLNFEYAEPVKI